MPDTHKKSPVIVWSTDTRESAPILQAISETRQTDIRDAPPEANELHGDGTEVLLFYPAPAQALYKAMKADTPPGVALETWRRQGRKILELNRTNRQRVHPINSTEALSHPYAFAKHFSLVDNKVPVAERTNEPEDPVLHLIARHLLLEDSESQRLIAELEAVSLPFSNPEEVGGRDADTIFQSVSEVWKETDALKKQLAEHAETAQKLQMAEAAQDLLQQQTKILQNELETVTRQHIEASESLETTNRLMKELETQRDNQQAEIKKLGAELHHVYNSHSYKVTSPLRRLRALLSGRR